MTILKNTIGLSLRRPLLILYLGLISLLIYLLNGFSPVFAIIKGLFTLGDKSFVESYISLIQGLLDINVILKFIPFVFIFVILLGAIVSLTLTGTFFIISKTLRGEKKTSGDISEGYKKYLLKTFIINVILFLSGGFFIFFNAVASVPAVILTQRLIEGRLVLAPFAIILDILTIFIIFFGFMYFRIYGSFWLVAAFNAKNKAFFTGIKRSNERFWYLVSRFFTFDLVFIIFYFANKYLQQYIVTSGENLSLIKYVSGIANWFFYTIFLISLLIFIFGSFNLNVETKKGEK